MARKDSRPDPNRVAYDEAVRAVWTHTIFRAMCNDYGSTGISARWAEDPELARDRAWARVHADGSILVNKNARGAAQEWTWVLAHCVLHLGFGHLEADRSTDAASCAAACLAVTRFQTQLRLGVAPMHVPDDLSGAPEDRLADLWRLTGVPAEFAALGCGGTGVDHLAHVRLRQPDPPGTQRLSWMDKLAIGLAAAASEAVTNAGEARVRQIDSNNAWEKARRWFVGHYPLLGALAAGFKIVADVELARSMQISVAAVDSELAEIYVNPLVRMTDGEHRFVLAHEMLHAALRHGERTGPRDAYLWNVAADFVVNGWLVEMGIGEMPADLLYDPELKGRGVEDVYDEITKNLRRYRKLATLRGREKSDMLNGATPGADESLRAGDLEDFYRRALTGGLSYHEQFGRGDIPASLVAEIRVLEHPPPPWDVQLAQWFDRFFQPLERSRSYARASRRQASTPDIPRPGWRRPEIPIRERTFGVVLDTSGSMNHELLGKALGAIVSYAIARDVPAARVVFCDALAYDAGYLAVEDIAGRVKVRGRGGTVLQPGINLLERADDFPADGPILIITDGYCDVVRVRREHAYLMPRGARLPFTPKGEVFRVR